ncbi:preprotein translocase subunit SecE [Thiothrix subterranea]|uniref:Protein translocase subunit SecE n=1 Tax=Thiothrix subterranea TaxID=2735563 RepID=A0AA51MRN2_9GAMM|nr:preprotein translocase subunit SecE [Thiothrix subterranea]MDQ5768460.1 preprotein translocase subunit SecE [Thiothrix subterranea]QQZ28483.1 preprotein translocase subunit SecE [Thiothrix subterranea]WML87046.1 preprotein translocase subunit SecE [Thiothrix subterranea]
MSVHTEEQGSSLDTVKLVISIALLFLGIVGFYYFENWQGQPVSLLLRVLGLLAIVGVAVAVALSSLSGKRLLGFMKDSRLEVRKMVWPTRAETLQTTLMVMVIVLILSIFLWGVDSLLGWGVKSMLGGGSV